MRLLVNAPGGEQQLIEIGEGGGYFDESRVAWDERVDGALPEITLGAMVRVEGELVFDQARLDEHASATAAASMPTLDTLTCSAWSIPADGVTSAQLTYTSDATVFFVVDGDVTEVEPVDYVAVLDIAADAAGAIQVQVKDKQIVIVATEV